LLVFAILSPWLVPFAIRGVMARSTSDAAIQEAWIAALRSQ